MKCAKKILSLQAEKNTKHMTISPEEFFKISSGLSDKDVENQRLRNELAQVTRERDLLLHRVLQMESNEDVRRPGFVQLSMEKIRGLLAKVQDLNVISTFVMFLIKALPDGTRAEDLKNISDLMHVPQQAPLTLAAQGDLKVSAEIIDIHGNNFTN